MTAKKPYSPEEFKTIYSKATRLCVDLVIKTPEGIALSLRNIEPYKGQWHFPGGTVFYREKITDTIKRVAMEEVGITVKIDKLLGYIEFPSEEKERGFGYTVSMAFLCSTRDEIFKPDENSDGIKVFKNLPANMVAEQYKFLRLMWPEIRQLKK